MADDVHPVQGAADQEGMTAQVCDTGLDGVILVILLRNEWRGKVPGYHEPIDWLDGQPKSHSAAFQYQNSIA